MFPFFKDRPLGGSLWQRFRTAPEGFTVRQEEPQLWAWHVVAGAERAVDLFTALLVEMPPVVTLEIADGHADCRWKGEDCDSGGVRSAIAPLRAALIAQGGVEITVFGPDDQVTLNPVLELFLYATREHWSEVLVRLGLDEQRMVRTQSWKLKRHGLTPAPALSAAVAAAAESLRLVSR